MEIHFELGGKCFLKCRHCSSMASELGKKMEYTENDIVELLNGIKEQKEVFFTGGEPLLYRNLEGLLSHIQEECTDARLGLFTTGIVAEQPGQERAVSDEEAEQLAASGLEVCYISVYSHLETEHDWMTRLPGAFKMLMESIQHLQNAGVEIRFNSVVTRRNMADYEKIVQLAETLEATEVRMLKLICQGRAYGCWQEIGITDRQYRDVVTRIMKKNSSVHMTASGVVDILPCRRECEKEICPAGKSVLYITEKGDIYPCASVKNNPEYKIGIIHEIDLEEKRRFCCEKLTGKMLCIGK